MENIWKTELTRMDCHCSMNEHLVRISSAVRFVMDGEKYSCLWLSNVARGSFLPRIDAQTQLPNRYFMQFTCMVVGSVGWRTVSLFQSQSFRDFRDTMTIGAAQLLHDADDIGKIVVSRWMTSFERGQRILENILLPLLMPFCMCCFRLNNFKISEQICSNHSVCGIKFFSAFYLLLMNH